MMYYKDLEESSTSIIIRAAQIRDQRGLRHLAQRDTRALPDGELLIALVGDEPRAAISLASGEVIADPFHRTKELVGILILRRAQLSGGRPRSLALKPLLGGRVGLSAATDRESPATAGLSER
jgi:hypothetical protein